MSALIALKNNDLVRRFGLAGFTFFLVKGLLWLAAPFLFMWFV